MFSYILHSFLKESAKCQQELIEGIPPIFVDSVQNYIQLCTRGSSMFSDCNPEQLSAMEKEISLSIMCIFSIFFPSFLSLLSNNALSDEAHPQLVVRNDSHVFLNKKVCLGQLKSLFRQRSLFGRVAEQALGDHVRLYNSSGIPITKKNMYYTFAILSGDYRNRSVVPLKNFDPSQLSSAVRVESNNENLCLGPTWYSVDNLSSLPAMVGSMFHNFPDHLCGATYDALFFAFHCSERKSKKELSLDEQLVRFTIFFERSMCLYLLFSVHQQTYLLDSAFEPPAPNENHLSKFLGGKFDAQTQRDVYFDWKFRTTQHPQSFPPGMLGHAQPLTLTLTQRVRMDEVMHNIFFFTLFGPKQIRGRDAFSSAVREDVPFVAYSVAEKFLFITPHYEAICRHVESWQQLQLQRVMSFDEAEIQRRRCDERGRAARHVMLSAGRYLAATERSQNTFLCPNSFLPFLDGDKAKQVHCCGSGTLFFLSTQELATIPPSLAQASSSFDSQILSLLRRRTGYIRARREVLFYAHYLCDFDSSSSATSSSYPPEPVASCEESSFFLPKEMEKLYKKRHGNTGPFFPSLLDVLFTTASAPEALGTEPSFPGPQTALVDLRKAFYEWYRNYPHSMDVVATSIYRESDILGEASANDSLSILSKFQKTSLAKMAFFDFQKSGFVGAISSHCHFTKACAVEPERNIGPEYASSRHRRPACPTTFPLIGFSTDSLSPKEANLLSRLYRGGILASPTGSGKTRCMIYYACRVIPSLVANANGASSSSSSSCVLAVVPDTLLHQWKKELEMCCCQGGCLDAVNPGSIGSKSTRYAICLQDSSDVKHWGKVLEAMGNVNLVQRPLLLVVSCRVLTNKLFGAITLAAKGTFCGYVVDEIHDFHGKKKTSGVLLQCVRKSRLFAQTNIHGGMPVFFWGISATPFHNIVDSCKLMGFFELVLHARYLLQRRQGLASELRTDSPVPLVWPKLLDRRHTENEDEVQAAIDELVQASYLGSDARYLSKLFLLSRCVVVEQERNHNNNGFGGEIQLPTSHTMPRVHIEDIVLDPASDETEKFMNEVSHLAAKALFKLSSTKEDCAKRRRIFALVERLGSDAEIDRELFLRSLANLCMLTDEKQKKLFEVYFRDDTLMQLPKIYLDKGDSCCVCLEPHQQPVCLVTCGHVFCAVCVLSVAEAALFSSTPPGTSSSSVREDPSAVLREMRRTRHRDERTMKCPACRMGYRFPVPVARGRRLHEAMREKNENLDLSAFVDLTQLREEEQGLQCSASLPCSSLDFFQNAGLRRENDEKAALLPGVLTAVSSENSHKFVVLDRKFREFQRRIHAFSGEVLRGEQKRLVVYFKYPSCGTKMLQTALLAFGGDNTKVLGGGLPHMPLAQSIKNIQTFSSANQGRGPFVILLHMDKFNYGLDLANVSEMWIMGYHRILSKNDQCEGRCQRMGQHFGDVRILRFINSNSYDEFMQNFSSEQQQSKIEPSVSNGLLLAHFLSKNKIPHDDIDKNILSGTPYLFEILVGLLHKVTTSVSTLLHHESDSLRTNANRRFCFCEECGRLRPDVFLELVCRSSKQEQKLWADTEKGDQKSFDAKPTRPRLEAHARPKKKILRAEMSFESGTGKKRRKLCPSLQVDVDLQTGTIQDGKYLLRETVEFAQALLGPSSTTTLEIFFLLVVPLLLGVHIGATQKASVEDLICTCKKNVVPDGGWEQLHREFHMLQEIYNWTSSSSLRTRNGQVQTPNLSFMAKPRRRIIIGQNRFELQRLRLAVFANQTSNYRKRQLQNLSNYELFAYMFSLQMSKRKPV